MPDPVAEPMSYGRRLAQLADADPEGVAVVFAGRDGGEVALTWRGLDRRANRVARLLAGRGVVPGDRVALRLGNTPELVTSVWAAWKLGAVPVPVRWDLPAWERERVLAVVDARVDLGDADRAWLRAAGTDEGPLPDAVSPATHGICSSGSTGTPKVIVIDRPALWPGSGPEPFPSGWRPIPRPQTVLVPAPMYHTNGFASLPNLLAGDRLVVLEKFDAARVLDLIERHRITALTATPTMLARIADVPGVATRDLSSLIWVLQGAAAIAPSLVRRWIGLVGAERFFMAYGMTEGLGTTALRGDEWLDHPGSVGRGYRGTEVRILGADGEPLPPGETGEIFLRSPGGAAYGYLGNASRLTVADGGFASVGDLGHLDEDGFLHIADRRSDLIVTGGANVFPAEVETALADHPAVNDVVVIGLRDPEWGRRVHAIVEPRDPSAPPSAEEVIAFAKGRLAGYKAPKTVEIVDRIPRSEATKFNRGALV
ncbi:MAG TPA: AMP-binding protein, partial [Acidimicrobiales bacterium]|nr:AMP-binding protein [Acidimicrobiales bacterium]